MHFLLALPTLTTVFVLAFMGFTVFRNSRDVTNKLFLVFLLSDSLWLLSVFLITQTGLGLNDSIGRFAYAIALALAIVIQVFSNQLFHMRHGKVYKIFLYGFGIVVVSISLMTNLVIKDVQPINGLPYPTYGPLYPIFAVYLLSVIGLFLSILFKRWKAVKKTKDVVLKRQLNVVVSGLGVFTAISLSTNFILPALLSNAWPSLFAPLGSLVLGASLFFAISKYRLFDIRTAVVRSTAYLFMVAILALLFAIVTNITGSTVASLGGSLGTQQIINTVLALFLAITFQPLKRVFDRLTDRYFFRDIYDTQEVVDRLNRILISNIEVGKLLSVCERLLVETLHLEFCSFIMTARTHQAEGISRVTVQDYNFLQKRILEMPNKVISMTDLSQEAKDIQEVFEKTQISGIGKMTAHDVTVGMVLFGNKKNGNPLSSQDLAVLGITADQLAIATQNLSRFEEIQNFNATLQQKIEDATRKLRHTNERLKVLDQTKDDFISMASHQLRTPLTSVKGYVSMVLEGDAGRITGLQRKLLNQSFVSAQRMVYLIADLLNVSRLRTGKFVIEATHSNLADVVGQEMEQLIETAKVHSLTLAYHKPEQFPTLMLDETKVRQVIMNFIDNAIYYTPQGGHIDVYLEDKPLSIEFRVRDNGMGVPKGEQPHLFTKFYRANNARRARPDGTGLGLFMAKKVIIAQGGAILFQSQEGKGSTFGFTIPKAKLEVAPIADELPKK